MKNILLFVAALSVMEAAGAEAQRVWRPFNDSSPWNQKIPPDVQIDPQSQELIDGVAKGVFNVNIAEWSIPLYYINADTVPKVHVINSRTGIYGRGFAEPNAIPILPCFVASPPVGEFSDNHMSIIDTARKIEWGMWATRKNKDGVWTTGLGAVTDLGGTGVERPWFDQERDLDAHRARAGGFPLVAGLIRPEEIQAGRIGHALVFAYQRGRSEFFVPPASTAQATFMEMDNKSGIPMGGRIQLDPVIDVDTLPLSPACKVIARALQEYGAFNGDYAGATVLYADNSPRAVALWEGVLKPDDFQKVFTPAFIRKYFRVIKLGDLLPGQNLAGGEIGFVAFTFPGARNVSVDWLARRVTCIADSSMDLAHVTPAFRTVRKNSRVSIDSKEQTSGTSVVDLRRPVTCRIEVPGVGVAEWTLIVHTH